MDLFEDFKILENIKTYNKNVRVKTDLIWGCVPVKKPLVSILMPVYNHPLYFKEALLSAINQVCDFDYEIIVVDNNHPDYQKDNLKIVSEISSNRVRYYVNSVNIGGCANFNKCASLANGDYITYCHDDDKLMPNALKMLLAHLKMVKNIENLIIGRYDIIDSQGLLINRSKRNGGFTKYTIYDCFSGNATNGCGALYNRQKFIEIGGYNECFIPCPDYALNAVYSVLYGAYIIQQPTFQYRVTEESDTANCFEELNDMDKRVRDLLIEYIPYIPKSLLLFFSDVKFSLSSYYRGLQWDNRKNKNRIKILCYRVIIKIYSMMISIMKLFVSPSLNQ